MREDERPREGAAQNQNQHTPIPRTFRDFIEVMGDMQLGQMKQTWNALAMHVGDGGTTWASQRRLADIIELTDRQVRNHLDRLETEGLLYRHFRPVPPGDEKGGRVTLYVVLPTLMDAQRLRVILDRKRNHPCLPGYFTDQDVELLSEQLSPERKSISGAERKSIAGVERKPSSSEDQKEDQEEVHPEVRPEVHLKALLGQKGQNGKQAPSGPLRRSLPPGFAPAGGRKGGDTGPTGNTTPERKPSSVRSDPGKIAASLEAILATDENVHKGFTAVRSQSGQSDEDFVKFVLTAARDGSCGITPR